MHPKKVLVTGVYGLIAGAVYARLQEQPDAYDAYGLARRRHPSERVTSGGQLFIPEDKFFLADLADLAALEKAMQGMDAVVHMAAGDGSLLQARSFLVDKRLYTLMAGMEEERANQAEVGAFFASFTLLGADDPAAGSH